MTTLIVMRHGEADWNAEHRWLSRTDRPLSENGRRQAVEAARRLRGVRVGRALTSDRRRARETADIVLGDRDVARIETRDLRERDYGSWEGLSDDDVEARFGAELARMLAGRGEGADDAEPQAGMIARVLGAVRRLCADHPDEVVLVVAHSGPVRAIHAAAAGLDLASLPGALPEAEHCSVAWFHADGNGTVRRIDGIGEAP